MERKVYEFISKTTSNPIIERRICRRTGEEFPIFQSERELIEKLSPTIGNKKYQLSLPTLSPKARQIKRLIWRNERKFYKFMNEQGKFEITTISPEMGLKTLSQSDFYDHDHMSYGIEYSGDFYTDMKKIFKAMPYPSKLTTNMENADYCNQETDDKNCYLNAGGHFNENSLYNTYSLHGVRTVDNYRVLDSENVYESINVYKSQKIFFSQQIENAFNIRFGQELKSCQNVLFGFGLNNANYVYRNKVLPKDEREKIFQSYKEKIATTIGLQEIQKEAEAFHAQFPKKAISNLNCERVRGNDMNNVKDALLCTVGEETQNIIYTNIFAFVSDCMDIESFGRGQKCYNFASSMQSTDCVVGSHILENLHSSYIYFNKNCSFLIGCAGLNHKKYCLLNKQYDEKIRENLTQKIIEELQSKEKFGEFFDPEDSPFPYNDSVAMDYYPVNERQVIILQPEKFISEAILDLGGNEKIRIKWRTRENEISTAEDKDIMICELSGRPFKFTSMELDFYRRHGLPYPHKHPDIRHAERFAKRQGRELYLRTCDKCGIEMLSVYGPTVDAQNITSPVYCENCYSY